LASRLFSWCHPTPVSDEELKWLLDSLANRPKALWALKAAAYHARHQLGLRTTDTDTSQCVTFDAYAEPFEGYPEPYRVPFGEKNAERRRCVGQLTEAVRKQFNEKTERALWRRSKASPASQL